LLPVKIDDIAECSGKYARALECIAVVIHAGNHLKCRARLSARKQCAGYILLIEFNSHRKIAYRAFSLDLGV
jgi:hypothetical protein